MKTTSDDDMEQPAAILDDLRNCLLRLDLMGESRAAAYVDAAIHALLGTTETIDSSEMD